jgi:competence protein ComEC
MKESFEKYSTFVKPNFKEYGKLYAVTLIIIVGLLFIFPLVESTIQKKVQVSFLDVGQGDSILIQTPSGHIMLIDGGPDNHVLEKLAEKLSYFDKHIDVLVATHADADHITGLIPVLKKYTVGHVVISPLAGHTGIFSELEKSINKEQVTTSIAKKGDEIIFGDGVVAHILYPGANFHGNEKDTNDASVSLVLTYGDESVLLTGDLPSTHEGDLLQDVLPHNITIYKAGHHGSKYSSGDKLLSYIHPEYAVISAGKDNRYGHPNPETLGRLRIYAQEILSTIDKGTITFLLDGKNVSYSTTK